MEQQTTLRPEIDREPIRLPGSPFWNVFKRFGRDEMIALAISLAGTLIASFFTTSILILAIVGPIVEKIGFFPAHLYEAYQLYKATPQKDREPLSNYIKRALKGGSISLAEDIVMHDPLYVLFFVAMSLYGGIPVWLISTFSFLAAVVVVAWLEVLITEGRYMALKRNLVKEGFGVESYTEARFFIRTGRTEAAVLERLANAFNMRIIEKLQYEDVYFRSDLPKFSGRAPVVRLRKRTMGEGKNNWKHLAKMFKTGLMQSVQIVYTRPREDLPERIDQFRFFSVKKDKFYVMIDDEKMPSSPRDIRNTNVRRLLRAGAEYRRVKFERTIMLDPSSDLYAAIDTGKDEGCVIELKVRENPALLLASMRFVMLEFPVTHTTVSKTELGLFN